MRSPTLLQQQSAALKIRVSVSNRIVPPVASRQSHELVRFLRNLPLRLYACNLCERLGSSLPD